MKLIDILNETLDFGVINEAGLSRLLQRIAGREFGIASAYRYGNTMAENKRKTGELLSQLNASKMGGYVLIGHWQEAPDGMDYKDTPKNLLVDTVEQSVLYIKPDDMPMEDFMKFNISLANKFKQDAVIVGVHDLNEEAKSPLKVYLVYKDGSKDLIGSRLTLGKVAQAYSQMRNKPTVPFVFEGTLQPSNNVGKQVFKIKNILYLG